MKFKYLLIYEAVMFVVITFFMWGWFGSFGRAISFNILIIPLKASLLYKLTKWLK